MELLVKILVCFLAGAGAGIGTGFAGMSAAAVIGPILMTFLGIPAYQAVGIGLASDVLASATSAWTYKKHKNLDVKNSLPLLISVLVMTLVGSFVASLLPERAMSGTMQIAMIFIGLRFLLKPVKTTKEQMAAATPKERLIKSIVGGVLVGFICGFVGAGGGMMLLFVLTSFLGYEMHMAVGTSVFIMAFTAVLNIFWVTDPGADPLFHWHFITIYEKGLYHALFILLRIVAMVIGTSLFLTYTTSPIALTDAIERLLYPLAKLHVPVHTFAMMMTIALRFIPTIVDETDKIMSAQKARGADFTTGSLASRAKALIPVIVPLFASAFRRADELATAMECRCYHGGEGRTRLRVLRCHARDFVLLAAVAVLIAGVVIINIEGARHGWLYTMQIGWFV